MTDQDDLDRLRYLQLKKKRALAMAGKAPANGSLMENLKADAKEQGKNLLSLGWAVANTPKTMLIDAPISAMKSVAEMARGVPMTETEAGKGFVDAVEGATKVPGAVVRRVKEIATNPRKAFVEKPITTVLDVASAVPVAGAGFRGAKAVTRAVSGAGRSELGLRALEAASGAPRKAIERRLVRPDQVRGAIPTGAGETPYAPLADELAKAVNEVGEKARTGAASATEKLSSSKYLMDRAIPKEEILKVVTREKARLRTQGSVVGEAKQTAMARLAKLEKQIDSIRGETVSEKNVKGLIKSLDPDINWKATENAPANLALERVRYRLDAKLKKGNTEYREAIAPVSRQMRVFKRSQRQFGLDKETGGGFVASDATASKLKSIGSGKVPMSERRLRQLESETGRDFTERARDIDAALQFEGGATQGSRRVVSFRDLLAAVGGATGAAVGGPTGAAVGAVGGGVAGSILGLITDTNGRRLAAKMIDNYLAVRPNATAKEIVMKNPNLKALIRYSMYNQTPQRAAMAYLGLRSVPSENR